MQRMDAYDFVCLLLEIIPFVILILWIFARIFNFPFFTPDKMLKTIVVVVLMVQYGYSHTYHTGECPSVMPMPEFDMRQVS